MGLTVLSKQNGQTLVRDLAVAPGGVVERLKTPDCKSGGGKGAHHLVPPAGSNPAPSALPRESGEALGPVSRNYKRFLLRFPAPTGTGTAQLENPAASPVAPRRANP